MRWLKIYEAFRSKGISSTLKFLNDKVGVNGSKKFLDVLKSFMGSVDYPIDKISDNDLIYLRSEKAKFLKNDEKPQNPLGIYYIKFWFSIKEGFLGITGTGKILEKQDIKRNQKNLDSDTLDYIKKNIISTGELYPVDNYGELRTGDTVLGCFSGSKNTRKISLAKIFVDYDDGTKYAIQGVSDGRESNDESWVKYNEYGSLSWQISSYYHFDEDHLYLYYWRDTPDELNIVDKLWDRDVKINTEKLDPYRINIPLDNYFKYSGWGGFYGKNRIY